RRAGPLHAQRADAAGVVGAVMTERERTQIDESQQPAGRIGESRGVDTLVAPTPHMPYRELEDSVEVSHIEHPENDELLTLNLGPHHPATHGVLRLLTTLEGEVVRDVKPMIGYVHTGIEKNIEDKSYWKAIPLIERMDYLAYYFNAMAYCGAVETLAGIEVPPRAQYLR